MVIKKTSFLILCLCTLSAGSYAQILKPGFDKAEYTDLLKIQSKVATATEKWDDPKALPFPDNFRFEYRSPIAGLDNLWDLWMHKTKPVAIVSIRGTVATTPSWIANVYAAMVPAKGSLQLDKNTLFNYTLSDDPLAAVHVGWLAAMGYLFPTIEHKIDSCYKAGIKDFILAGHSQGGGITFLLTAHLYHLQKEGNLPADIRFKTYCSAAPKPGNMPFAYDYENTTRGGWACNVVNAADWVPLVPLTVQTVDDFPTSNPFRNAKQLIKKQKFPKDVALKYMYGRLSKPSKKAVKNYQKYLGKMVSKQVNKTLPEFKNPVYYKSNDYVRTGNTIVLYPDSAYYNLYSNDPADPNVWKNHNIRPYLFLAERYDIRTTPLQTAR